MNFENKDVDGIYYSRFIASWTKAVAGPSFGSKFRRWLRSLIINGHGLSDEQIDEICLLAENGKLELEVHAKLFLAIDGINEED